jgi:hypothetical protein
MLARILVTQLRHALRVALIERWDDFAFQQFV